MQSISLPNSIQNIEYGAFEGCIRLQEITIPNTVTSIYNTAFEGCNNLTIKGYTGSYAETYANEHNIPFESIGNAPEELDFRVTGVEWTSYNSAQITCSVNKDGWYYAGLVEEGAPAPDFDTNQPGVSYSAGDSLVIPLNNITVEGDICVYVQVKDNDGYLSNKISRYLYNYDRPQNPNIQIGDDVYATVNGDTLTIRGNGETREDLFRWWEEHFNPDAIKKVVFAEGSSVTKLGNRIFEDMSNISEIILPDTITEIGNEAFSGCTSLEKITIPSATIIGESAFDRCTSLKNISLPDNLETIESGAFSRCSSLEIIIIPSANTIQDSAFGGCNSLKKIEFPDNLQDLGHLVFWGCYSLEEIVFPKGLEIIPMLGDDYQLTKLEKVVIPEGIKNISGAAFMGCTSLKDISLPKSIESIGNGAFSGTGITEFNWPANITTISDGVFGECKNLKSITIPDGITKIGAGAFAGSDQLSNVSIPETVTYIGESAFRGCSSLESISISKEVTYFGNDAFYNCSNLTIYGYRDSAAEKYANNNSIPFVSADYKVIFKDNGRTQKTEYVLKGQNATPPILAAKDGYTLSWDGDYTDIQEDMIINAVWTKKESGSTGGGNTTIIVPDTTTKYTVTFIDRGEVVKTEKVKSGEAADRPFIQRGGYKLTWDKDFSKVTGDLTVNAVWTVITPAKVTSLTAEVQKTYIALSWDETEYTNYYLVYRKAAADENYKQIAKTTKILCNDKTAQPGTEYQYKVVAVRSVDSKKYQSEDSEIVTAKIGVPEKGNIYTVKGMNYKVMSDKEVRVTGMAKTIGDVVIPSTVTISGKTFNVTSIDHKAFYKNENIYTLKIGSNVTYVGQYSFYKCPNLKTVKFGGNVQTISTCAFTQCPQLGNMILPTSVKRLGAKVFYHCPKLKTLTIKSEVLEYIGKKGLAIDKKTVIKVPAKKYAAYKTMITDSIKFNATKIVKF